MFDTLRVRTAYRCRAYPDDQQQQTLNRTFSCVRVVWNQTLAARHARWQADRTATSYAETDAALTLMKKDPDLAFLTEVSSVPLQQALRHQHQAFTAFFARRARFPRFKSRRGRQAAHYTRRAFTMRGGELRLAKTVGPLRFTWSWPEVDVAAIDPTMVIICREPDGRWYVTFTIDTDGPGPLEPAGHAVGVDLGVTDFAVTSDGERIANRAAPGAQGPQPGPLPAAPGPLPERLGEPSQGRGEAGQRPPKGPPRAAGLPSPRQHAPGPRERHDRDRRSRGQEHGP